MSARHRIIFDLALTVGAFLHVRLLSGLLAVDPIAHIIDPSLDDLEGYWAFTFQAFQSRQHPARAPRLQRDDR